jgi:hypothetical protein
MATNQDEHQKLMVIGNNTGKLWSTIANITLERTDG